MLDPAALKSAIPNWLEEAKALPKGSPEQAKLVQTIKDAIGFVEESEMRDVLMS
jgi:hypothetical protein